MSDRPLVWGAIGWADRAEGRVIGGYRIASIDWQPGVGGYPIGPNGHAVADRGYRIASIDWHRRDGGYPIGQNGHAVA
jgi:hypothetical protein